MLVTVQTLSEGIDIPCADTAFFVEPRSARINVIQCVGRVLRRCPATGKSLAHIVLPSADEEAMVRKFLQCFNAEDSRFAKGFKTNGRAEFVRASADESESVLQYVSVYDRYGRLCLDSWMEKYMHLLRYVEEHGELPLRSVKEGGLGNW